MSVRTEAHEQLDKAQEAIETAVDCLTKLIAERCWGCRDEFSKEWQAKHCEPAGTEAAYRKG